MPIVCTRQDPYVLVASNTSFPSISKQTHTSWTLILIGDGIDIDCANRIRAVVAKALPMDRVIFRILEERLTERSMYKNKVWKGCGLWCFASSNSINFGLDIASKLPHISHIARIDDDDTWSPNHLQNLILGFGVSKEVRFVYTRGRFTEGRILPESGSFPTHKGAVRYPPVPCQVADSSTSWSKSLNLRLRQPLEQLNASRSMISCCAYTTCRDVILPNDADLWERVWGDVANKRYLSILVPDIDVIKLDRPQKNLLLEQLLKSHRSSQTD